MRNKKIKTVFIACAAVVAVLAVIICAVIFSGRKTDFPHDTKSTVAMGTVVTAKVYGEKAAAHTDSISKLISSVEDMISWRVSGSPVYELNENGTVDNSILSELVESCLKVSAASDGAFDVTIGKISRLWDFDSEKAVVPENKKIEALLADVDYTKLTVNGSRVTLGENQMLDLGAVGKGFACDSVRAYLEKSGVEGAVVSVGGSILVYGNRNKAGDKWRVAIRDPKNESGYIGTLLIDEGFVSTSGNYEKCFEKDGKLYHHLLDARTGYPAENGLLSVTVICDNGALSDALSTACFLLGIEDGSALVEKFGAKAVFVDSDMNITTVGDVEFKAAR